MNPKQRLHIFCLTVICLLIGLGCRTVPPSGNGALAKVYYVIAEYGKDSNEGTSPEKAWASLKKINKQVFKPGDKILLAAGSRFIGRLEPKGSGTALAPICLDRYGKGPNPAIDGEGKALHTLLLYNVEYWQVRNLEITNKGKKIMNNEFYYFSSLKIKLDENVYKPAEDTTLVLDNLPDVTDKVVLETTSRLFIDT